MAATTSSGSERLRTTERALKVAWPVEVFETWGHYPMIDVPEEWTDALRLALGPAGSVPRTGRSPNSIT